MLTQHGINLLCVCWWDHGCVCGKAEGLIKKHLQCAAFHSLPCTLETHAGQPNTHTNAHNNTHKNTQTTTHILSHLVEFLQVEEDLQCAAHLGLTLALQAINQERLRVLCMLACQRLSVVAGCD